MKINKTMIRTSCPNCGCQWGMEEMDWNNCFACGWPDNEDDYDEDDYYDEDEQEIDGIILPPKIT